MVKLQTFIPALPNAYVVAVGDSIHWSSDIIRKTYGDR